METNVQQFYTNKIIFITGGSGFLGRVVIEKLLRSTQVARIYVLMRPKKGQQIDKRIEAWSTDPLFATLLRDEPTALQRVQVIAGDCAEPELGISQADRQLLVETVHIVMHMAATVRFDEALHKAVLINLRATKLMLQLAKQMQRLQSVVHVSTAYSNCVVQHIAERYYPEHLNCSADKLLKLQELLSHEELESLTPVLLGKFPNTYTYTKALAEQLVEMEGGELPLCIFRPGMITSTYKEPVYGWNVNMNGPMGIVFGALFGVLRVAFVNPNTQSGMVPVDYCANVLLPLAYRTATDKMNPSNPKPIYNFVPNEQNNLTWGEFNTNLTKVSRSYPLSKMRWLPFLIMTTSPLRFALLCFFYHTLPGCIVDLVLMLQGKKPYLLSTYDKISKNIELLRIFATNTFHFETHNTDRLWSSLSMQEQKLFEFDMSKLDWNEYLTHTSIGLRIYLAKDDPGAESLERAKQIQERFRILHCLLKLVVSSAAAVILWSMTKFLYRRLL